MPNPLPTLYRALARLCYRLGFFGAGCWLVLRSERKTMDDMMQIMEQCEPPEKEDNNALD